MPETIKTPAGPWRSPSPGERGVSFHIDWQGGIGQMLLRAAQQMQNYEPMLRTIGRQVTATSKRTFQMQAAPDGTPWAPLKHARGRRHNQNPIVLFDTGALERGIDWRLVAGNAVQIFWTKEYGKHHQFGAPRAHIPARPFLGPGPEDIPGAVTQWVNGEVFAWPGVE